MVECVVVLLLLLMACGWLLWCAEIWLLTPLRWMVVCSECLALYATWPPDWPFCDWQVSEACHSGGANDYLCTASWFGTQSCKRAVSELQSALAAKAGVRCTNCVRACERAFSDYSEKFPQTQHEVLTVKLQFASHRLLLQIDCQPGASFAV